MNKEMNLQQVIAMSDTNLFFIEVIKRNFNNTISGRFLKRDFIDKLRVNLGKIKPVYFTFEKYIKKQHENNLFIFINKELKIIGILKGNTWDESAFSKYEKIDKYHINKNRKHLSAASEHILMIPNNERNYLRPSHHRNKVRTPELRTRLKFYKEQKLDAIPNDLIISKLNYLIKFLVDSLINEDKRVESLFYNLENEINNLISARKNAKYYLNYDKNFSYYALISIKELIVSIENKLKNLKQVS
jgi:hypothetical protein